MMVFLGNLLRWWRLRQYRDGQSESERLAAMRAYTDWVRHPPSPPERAVPNPPEIPVPVVPPVRGVAPFPGRRRLGD